VQIPFPAARNSISTLFTPLMEQPGATWGGSSNDAAFGRVHASLFSPGHAAKRAEAMAEFLGSLDLAVSRATRAWLQTGWQMAVANANAVLGYGAEDHCLMRVVQPRKGVGEEEDVPMAGTSQVQSRPQIQSPDLEGSVALMAATSDVVYRRFGDPNVYPYLHASLVFLRYLSAFPAAMYHVQGSYPWKLLSQMLNTLLPSGSSRIEGEEFPREASSLPLSEDYALRGLLWTADYFPDDWFAGQVDDDERGFEAPSMTEHRKERVRWLACRLAQSGRFLTYADGRFGVAEEYDVEVAPSQ